MPLASATPPSAAYPPNTVSPPPPPKAWSTFRDLVMTPAQCKAPPRATVTRTEALADASVVERIVRRGWAGYETMTRTGADFDAVFAALARWIAEAPEPIAVSEFHERLVLALRPAGDNHMAFFEYGEKGHTNRKSVGRSYLAYTADLPVSAGVNADLSDATVVSGPHKGAQVLDCAGRAPRFVLHPTILGGTTSADPLRMGARPIVVAEAPPAPLRCRLRPRGASVTATVSVDFDWRRLRVKGTRAQSAAPAPAFDRRDGLVPVLTVRTFWTAKETELAAFVATGEKLRDAKAIVIDVRGNTGGSDTYAKDWLAQLTNQELKGSVVDRLDSDVTRQGIVNENTCAIAEGIDDATALRETNERLEYGRRVVNEAEAADAPLRAWKSRTVATKGRAPTPFTAPLVTLVDKGCASACESFVSHARQLSDSVVVGENTGGVGIFGEVLVYRLPKSGLGMSAGMKYFHDPDSARAIPEGRGLSPDYWLDSDDPVRDAERIAECLTKPTCALRRK